ncbi:hypothetical protein BD309DRAFT_959642 [Dichomitus squalens]|nr:hypothetical protein BD309DRAFT_959642 [Dichomitus squalens]
MGFMLLRLPEHTRSSWGWEPSASTIMSPSNRRCQALLIDEETPCPARVRRKGRYCDPHGVEYRELTRRYKSASATVETLDRDILEAIGEEIEGRRTHHKRFFQTSEWLAR